MGKFHVLEATMEVIWYNTETEEYGSGSNDSFEQIRALGGISLQKVFQFNATSEKLSGKIFARVQQTRPSKITTH